MTKISSLNVSSLRIEEDFGFMKQVKAELETITDEAARTAVKPTEDAFTVAFNAFDDALKLAATSPSASTAAEADYRRDRSWSASNAYVSAMANHPTEATAQAARRVKEVYDRYGNPTSLPQTEESGVLHNLLQDLKALSSEDVATVAFQPWLTDLEAAEDAFLAAARERTAQDAARVVGASTDARKAMDNAYRALVDRVNALAVVNGPEAYATFIDHMNALIDRQKTVLKARSTTNARKNAPAK